MDKVCFIHSAQTSKEHSLTYQKNTIEKTMHKAQSKFVFIIARKIANLPKK